MIENNSTEAGTEGHRPEEAETLSRQAQGGGWTIRSFAPSRNPPTHRERVPPSAEAPFRWSCRPTIRRRPCPHVPLPPIKHIKHPIASGPSPPPIVPAAESHYGKTLGTSVFSKVRTDFSKVLREFPEVLRVLSKVPTIFSDVITAVSKTPDTLPGYPPNCRTGHVALSHRAQSTRLTAQIHHLLSSQYARLPGGSRYSRSQRLRLHERKKHKEVSVR